MSNIYMCICIQTPECMYKASKHKLNSTNFILFLKKNMKYKLYAWPYNRFFLKNQKNRRTSLLVEEKEYTTQNKCARDKNPAKDHQATVNKQ